MAATHPIVQFVKDQPSDILARLKTQAGRKSPPHIFVAGVRKALTSPAKNLPALAIRDAIWASGTALPMEIHVIDLNGFETPKSDRLFITAQFNPAELERGIKVNYAELKPVGLPHAHMHYVGTDNQSMKFSLFLNAFSYIDAQEGKKDDFLERGKAEVAARMKFLEAICYPVGENVKLGIGAPPRVLVSWINFMSLTCVLTDLTFKVTRWAPTGEPLHVQADLTLREIRQARLSMELLMRKKNAADRGDDEKILPLSKQ